jgi:26S proteasome regulatory subunit N7
MAASFGITTLMLDKELSHFIASGRLNAKIDKVGDVVETVKSDKRNAQYQDVIKKGDQLLNQVQKLVRVIDQ